MQRDCVVCGSLWSLFAGVGSLFAGVGSLFTEVGVSLLWVSVGGREPLLI